MRRTPGSDWNKVSFMGIGVNANKANEVLEPSSLQEYRELFPITKERAYLNHASLGVLSSVAVNAMTRHLLNHARHGSDAKPEWEAMKQRVRKKMAAFVGAEPQEIAITKNTPESLSILAAGIPWKSGDRIVISDLEFPANSQPWLILRKYGVEVIAVRSRCGCVPLEDLVAAMDSRTRLVSLSWVQFSTGCRSDLKAIGEVCRERGIYFAVDAMQGLGALPLNVKDLNIDFFGAASHKWLCGPTGVGWFYCRRELMEVIEVRIAGQGSYARGPYDSWLTYGTELWPDARRFEPGLANYIGLSGLEAALDLLSEIGMHRIETQIRQLTDRLAEGLLEREFYLAAARGEKEWSGVVSFASDRIESVNILERLETAGVTVALREGFVRVSPHFFNTEEEIERLLAALPHNRTR
jgi:cysteine desulfurase / selenocysteine lyase